MPFPTAPAATEIQVQENTEFKAHNFQDLDGLLSDLNTKRQNFDPPAPAPGAEAAAASAPGFQPFPGYQEPAPQITREDAERAGHRMAVLIDSMVSTGGMMIAKADESEPYKASEGEIKDLAEAWSDVSEEYNFKINPWFNILILTLMIYTPKIIQANNDRRLNKMEADIKELKANAAKMNIVRQQAASNE